MNSRHLTGHAVDIAPLDEAGQISWAWSLFFPLADAVRAASIAEKVPVIWGGAWGMLMSDYATAKEGQARYRARMDADRRRAFLDGPHFELDRRLYP